MEEKKNLKRSSGLLRKTLYLFSVLLIMGGFVRFSVFACNDSRGLIINIAVIILMTVIICTGLGNPIFKNGIGIFTLERAINDLKYARSLIEKEMKNPNAELMDLMYRNELFEEPHMKKSFQAFLYEKSHLNPEPRAYKYCDIQDFINDDLLEQIVNSSLNDLIGGAMTGLGILGTFIGLTLGLANFKNGNADELMESIKPLMDGIKIAFLTSIYGMIFSLVYNFFYKSRMREAQNVLDDFLDIYYKNEKHPENEGFTMLIKLQSEQNNSMKQLAEDISVHFADKLKESLIPSMVGIQDTIEKLAASVAESQNEKLGEIAEGFVTHIDEAMGNQFTHLGESIEQLCDWQELVAERMQKMADEVLTSGEKLQKVNEGIQQSVETLGGFVEDLKQSQIEANTSFAKVLDDSKVLIELANQQSEFSSNLFEKSGSIVQAIIEIEEVMNEKTGLIYDELDKHLNRINEYFDQRNNALSSEQEKLENLMKMISEEMRSSAQGLNEASKELTDNLDGSMERTYKQIDELLGQIVVHFSGTINEMREVTEKIPKLYYDSSHDIEQQVNNYLKVISSANTDMERMIHEIYDAYSMTDKPKSSDNKK